MAIWYFIYTDLEVADLEGNLQIAAQDADDLWWYSAVSDDLGPFHLEIMEHYGVKEAFRSRVSIKQNKFYALDARIKTLEFYAALPGRKLVLNEDSLVALQER